MLKCSKCSTEKLKSEFYNKGTKNSTANKYRGGYTYWCKQCYAAHYRENRERQLASNQRARVKLRYGLELEEYYRLKENGCEVCGEQRRVHIDHCHETGVVRGALCSGCNVTLGQVNDSPVRLRALADYVERHHEKLGVDKD